MLNKKYILLGLLTLVMVGLVVLLFQPTPKQCDGLNDPNSICYRLASEYDKKALDTTSSTFYRLDNGFFDTVHVNNFSVYVENSASMDGYLCGNDFTKFKEVIASIQKTGYYISDTVNCYLINNKISYICSDNNFARTKLGLESVKNKDYGDRTNTDISEVLKSVISKTGGNSISVLFSDFVLSPRGSTERDIQNHINDVSDGVMRIVQAKLDSAPRMCVLFSRYLSEFNGIYYGAGDGTNKVQINGIRPFYAFFVGDYGVISKFLREHNDMLGESSCLFLTTQTDIPYGVYSGQLKTINNEGHRRINKHLLMPDEIKNKVERDSDAIMVNLKVDLSCLPLDSAYLTNEANYSIDSDLFHIYKVTQASEEDAAKYTHVIVLKSNKAIVPNNSLVRVHLSNNENIRPCWDLYNTYQGKAANTLSEDSLKTLGIEPLRKGIEKAYDQRSSAKGMLATFEFIIN